MHGVPLRFAGALPGTHGAPGAGAWLALASAAVLCALLCVIFLVEHRRRPPGHDADEGDSWPGGGGGPDRPPEPDGDGGPAWWPEFERQFEAYVERMERWQSELPVAAR